MYMYTDVGIDDAADDDDDDDEDEDDDDDDDADCYSFRSNHFSH